jgi:hypothetical protein
MLSRRRGHWFEHYVSHEALAYCKVFQNICTFLQYLWDVYIEKMDWEGIYTDRELQHFCAWFCVEGSSNFRV